MRLLLPPNRLQIKLTKWAVTEYTFHLRTLPATKARTLLRVLYDTALGIIIFSIKPF